MQTNVLRFPRERVPGRRVVMETRIYQFARPVPPAVAVTAAKMPMIAWCAWSIAFCALCIAVLGR